MGRPSQALDRIGIDGVEHAVGSGPAHYKSHAGVFFESKAAIFLFCRKTQLTRLIRHAHRFFYCVGTIGRFLRDLKDGPIEGDGIIVGHRTLFFKAQRLIDRLGMDLSPGGLGEFTVVLAEVAIEHGLGLGKCFGFGQSQFTGQSVLESSPQSYVAVNPCQIHVATTKKTFCC